MNEEDRERFFLDLKMPRVGWSKFGERRFGEIYILSCGTHSWYKDRIGETRIAALVGYDLKNGLFVIKHPYDFEIKGSRLAFKKPYSIIDIILL